MKTKKRRMEIISFYNHTGLEKHFTKMAKKGWLIESMTNLYWTYRKIEPKDIHFCVTYYPRASEFDSEPSEQQQTFYDFCAHTGWQLACTWFQMQVFYNEKEDPIPLETDPVLEVETLHNACKKNFLPTHFILLAISLIQLGSFVAKAFTDPIGLLSSAGNMVVGFMYACIAVIIIGELSSYFLWHVRAKKAARDGIFIETPSTAKVQLSVVILLLIVIAGWILDAVVSVGPLYMWMLILIPVELGLLFAAVNGIKRGLKKAKVSRGVNWALTLIACFVLFFVMTSGVTHLSLFIQRSDSSEHDLRADGIPLSLADLTDINEEDYAVRDTLTQSMLVGKRVISHFPKVDNGSLPRKPDLLYTIIAVKVPFLYDLCKNQLFNTEGYDGSYIIEYLGVDAAPWGAEEAYRQLDKDGTIKNSYLLFYQDRFVLIHLDWEPTAEQMEIVAQKLNP